MAQQASRSGARGDSGSRCHLGVDRAGRLHRWAAAASACLSARRPASGGGHRARLGPRHAGVNITIDDGPDPAWTPQVLQLLKDSGVKATFCMVGTQAQAHPDLVKAVVADGHRLCNHTVSHDTTMDTRSEAYQSQQILDAERMITKASGASGRSITGPRAALSPRTAESSPRPGHAAVGLERRLQDFERPGADTMVATVKREISNGPTVLFHDAGGIVPRPWPLCARSCPG
ncbi:polysaccharide deacetylase family protein [Streptomyces sp. M10(2022)]